MRVFGPKYHDNSRCIQPSYLIEQYSIQPKEHTMTLKFLKRPSIKTSSLRLYQKPTENTEPCSVKLSSPNKSEDLGTDDSKISLLALGIPSVKQSPHFRVETPKKLIVSPLVGLVDAI